MRTPLKLMILAAFLLASTALTSLPSDAVASPHDELLALVPADAISVGMIRVDDMRHSPTAQKIFARMSAGGFDLEANSLMSDAGLTPTEDLDQLMVVLRPSTTSEEPQVLVAASGRFEPARLSAAVQKRGATAKVVDGITYFLLPEEEVKPGQHPAVCFYDGKLVIGGMEPSVVNAIRTIRSGQDHFASTALGRELFRIDMRASGWMLLDVQRAQALHDVETPGASPFGDQAYTALKNISTASFWVAESSSGLEFGSSALAADAETRGLVEDVLKGVLSTVRIAAQEKQPELVKVVRTFKVASDGDAVTLSGSVPPAVIDAFVAQMN